MNRAWWIVLPVSVFASCGPPRNKVIVVGSKNFTEQVILGEMLTQYLHQQTILQMERRF